MRAWEAYFDQLGAAWHRVGGTIVADTTGGDDMADFGAGGRPRTCEHQATREATDHAAAIKRLIANLEMELEPDYYNDSTLDGIMEINKNIEGAAHALAAENAALRRYARKKEKQVQALLNEIADSAGIPRRTVSVEKMREDDGVAAILAREND